MADQLKDAFSPFHTKVSQSFDLRLVTDAHLPAILEVYRQCEDFLALGPRPHASRDMVQADLARSKAEGGTFYGIYDSQLKMVGVVDFVPSRYSGNPDCAFLSLLMIASDYRNAGLGRAVVQKVESEIARNKQVRTILSGVQVDNPTAIHFWQRCGYEITGGSELLPDQTTVFHLHKSVPPHVIKSFQNV